MTLTLELTPEEEAALKAAAAEAGVDEARYLKGLIDQARTVVPPDRPMTGKEALAFWEREGVLGIFDDRPEDSPELARTLRRQAETRDSGEVRA